MQLLITELRYVFIEFMGENQINQFSFVSYRVLIFHIAIT